MLPANLQTDPIVEILRLAYRRGLAIRKEQEEKNRTVNDQPSDRYDSTAEGKDEYSRKESKPRRGK